MEQYFALLRQCPLFQGISPQELSQMLRLLSNLLHVVAAKNLLLTQKLSFLSKRTTKEKLMAYLMEEARRAGSPTFRLPYDRQGLADYLGVDRSAMSAELSKLRRAGVLDCKGRDVTLHKSTS